MREMISFDQFLTSLPGGNFKGQQQLTAFRVSEPKSTFVPPNLSVVVSSEDPLITLVSARGATGKSRLAEEVSAIKQVPLWLLNEDKAVSGDALRTRLGDYTDTKDGLERLSSDPNSFLLIDALDEARMRVSGASWYEYAQTLFSASAQTHSLVLFGRERVLEDIWAKSDNRVNWFEISHFDEEQRARYIDLYVGNARTEEREAYAATRDTVLAALSGAVDGHKEADSFIGYAPVLYAVALLLSKGNLINIRASFESEVGNAQRIRVLGNIIEELLKREQEKTTKLAEELETPAGKMYRPEEQVDWLAHHLLGADEPDLSWCEDESLQSRYCRNIREFLDDHPFRSEGEWANPVFSAYIAAERFDKVKTVPLQEVGAATGLLFEFLAAKHSEMLIDESQLAALHTSLVASERHDVEVSVSLAGGEPLVGPGDGEGVDTVTGELSLWESSGSRWESSDNRKSIAVDVVLGNSGVFDLKGPLASLSLEFPNTVTVNPSSGSATFGPDCFIRCRHLQISGESMQISIGKNTVGGHHQKDGVTQSGGPDVTFELTGGLLGNAQLVGEPTVDSFELLVPPTVRMGHPWFRHQKELGLREAEPNERAVRFVKMMMNLMRNHGHKGTPAVFDKKLEGRQSVKGHEFKHVIARLRADGVVAYEGPMIHLLSPWTERRFSGKERAGVQTFEHMREVWRPVVDAIQEVLDD
ncbi:hypothetical protein [Streptomyces sp. NPDC058451]|uniref:hypothetical protein n=1 Tax=Streptomyces sp. NPDC058451 TaxID=3346506 RepID=UPI0036500F87